MYFNSVSIYFRNTQVKDSFAVKKPSAENNQENLPPNTFQGYRDLFFNLEKSKNNTTPTSRPDELMRPLLESKPQQPFTSLNNGNKNQSEIVENIKPPSFPFSSIFSNNTTLHNFGKNTLNPTSMFSTNNTPNNALNNITNTINSTPNNITQMSNNTNKTQNIPITSNTTNNTTNAKTNNTINTISNLHTNRFNSLYNNPPTNNDIDSCESYDPDMTKQAILGSRPKRSILKNSGKSIWKDIFKKNSNKSIFETYKKNNF